MAIVTLFDLLGDPKSTTGTWTRTSATGPAAPGTHNGTIDTTAEPEGTYTYDYTVVSGSCNDVSTVSVTKGVPKNRTNDACVGASNVFFPVPGSFSIIPAQDNLDNCPGDPAPTDSGVALPAAWGGGPFTGDLWYKLTGPNLGGTPPTYTLQVTITGQPYPSTGIGTPVIAIYDGTCGTLNELDADISANNAGIASVTASHDTNATTVYFVRVASEDGTEGQFDLRFETI
jgi:hypothetical protein